MLVGTGSGIGSEPSLGETAPADSATVAVAVPGPPGDGLGASTMGPGVADGGAPDDAPFTLAGPEGVVGGIRMIGAPGFGSGVAGPAGGSVGPALRFGAVFGVEAEGAA